jgi:hypothetical protein
MRQPLRRRRLISDLFLAHQTRAERRPFCVLAMVEMLTALDSQNGSFWAPSVAKA